MIDHRFTDFLAAKRDLFLFAPDEKALARFQAAIRALHARAVSDAEIVGSDAQRAFFLRRFAQEIEALIPITLTSDLAKTVDTVQSRLVEIQDRARAYTM
jgi:hypothetical protein